jgi:VanZ family protein
VNQLYANFATAVPVLLWGGVVALVFAVRALVVHSPRGAARAIALYCVYAIALIALWPHSPSHARTLQLVPFDNLLSLLQSPNDGLQVGYSNIALFVPFGVFIPLGWEWARPFWRTTLLAAGLALALEIAQFIVGGHESSVNDIILNTAGAAIGWLAMRAGMALWHASSAGRHRPA